MNTELMRFLMLGALWCWFFRKYIKNEVCIGIAKFIMCCVAADVVVDFLKWILTLGAGVIIANPALWVIIGLGAAAGIGVFIERREKMKLVTAKKVNQ